VSVSPFIKVFCGAPDGTGVQSDPTHQTDGMHRVMAVIIAVTEEVFVMARISLDPPKTLGYRILSRLSRSRYGIVVDPGAALAHNMPVTRSYALFEFQVQRWRGVDHELKDIAVMAAAAAIGCAWCLDFGYWEATMMHKVPAEKVRAVPEWRDSGLFTDLERLVLEYAEAMTATPPAVTDHMAEGLRHHLGESGLVELTAIVAVENLRSRMNAALGLTAQGFKDRCDVQDTGSMASAGRRSERRSSDHAGQSGASHLMSLTISASTPVCSAPLVG
jgi:alkylhydroperoxidase family enzyme